MKQFITETMSFASGILSRISEGIVHSVYRKTINLRMGSSLVALQAAGSPLSPVSLITGLDVGEMSGLPVGPGDQVFVDKKTIILFSKSSRIIFRFDEAAIYDSLLRDYTVPLPLRAIKESLLQSSSGGLTELFSKAPRKNPSDFAKGVFLAVAQKRMEDARKEVLEICYDKAAVTLAGMTGLGMGLTPSGDDFLCGVLAGLLFSGQWDHPFAQALRQTISRRLGDTNDISRTFLSCALSCHFSRPVKELPLASGTTEILSSFGAIGHSSGFDTLCGIYYGYTLCLSQEDVPGK